MKHLLCSLMLAGSFLTILSACGGGGGSGGIAVTANHRAVATMKTSQLTATGIYGIDMTLDFPYGVTVATDASGAVASGVVQITGQQGPNTSVGVSRYTPSTTATKGTLRFLLVSPNGFAPGEFVKVQLDISPGFSPKSSDFGIVNFAASDKDGFLIQGLTAEMTALVL